MTPRELRSLAPDERAPILEWWRARHPFRGREVEALLARLLAAVLNFAGDKSRPSALDVAPWLRPVDHEEARQARRDEAVLALVREMDM